MSHSHHHTPPKNALSLAFWMNFLFAIVECIWGILTGSTAIIADAFHDAMDALSIAVAIMLEKISNKKRTPKFSYGWKRFSLLWALFLSSILLIGSIGMLWTAYQSFFVSKEIHSIGMLGLAVFWLMVNGFAFWKIKQSGDHHGHHWHNHNSQSIMLHLLEDVLGWLAVLVGAIIIYATGWNWVDGVLTIGIALFIGWNALKNLTGTFTILLQSIPENIDISRLETELISIDGITDIHDMHVWSLDGSYIVASVHAIVDDVRTKDDILEKISHIMQKYKIHHPTIQIETPTTNCHLQLC